MLEKEVTGETEFTEALEEPSTALIAWPTPPPLLPLPEDAGPEVVEAESGGILSVAEEVLTGDDIRVVLVLLEPMVTLPIEILGSQDAAEQGSDKIDVGSEETEEIEGDKEAGGMDESDIRSDGGVGGDFDARAE